MISRLVAILFNLVELIFHGTQNLLKVLGVRGEAPPWVTFRLGGDPKYRKAGFRFRLPFPRRGNAEWERDLETFFDRLSVVAKAGETKGVVLRLEALAMGRAKALAVARQLRVFGRESGKQVVVWTAALEGDALTLGLAADRVLVAPAGRVGVKGSALEVTTARRALGHLGAKVRVIRRGTHKAAGEVFTEDGISEPYRETLEGLLEAAHQHRLQQLIDGRGVDRDRALAWIDAGPFTAEDALAAGLIDGLCYGDEVADALSEGERPRLAPWPAFASSRRASYHLRPVFRAPPRVAVLSLRGLITEGESRVLPGGSRTLGDRSVAESLSALRRDKRVRAILLRVDSRGGSAHASDLIWHEVARTAKKKPVVAWLENVAASGGYYLAAAADEILAAPLCLTGSIGVIAALFDLSGVYEKLGLSREILARGALASLGTTSRAPTPAEREHLDAQVGQLYETFKARVAEGRGLSPEAVEAVAQGRVFPAEVAKTHGLIDAVGGFEEAVEATRRRVGVRKIELSFHEPGGGGLLSVLPGVLARATATGSSFARGFGGLDRLVAPSGSGGPSALAELAWLARGEMVWALELASLVEDR